MWERATALLSGWMCGWMIRVFLTSACASLQGPEALCGRHLRGPRAQPGLPHGDVHLLRGLLRGLPLLLRQHLCGFDHHHLPGAGGQGHVGVQPGKERGLRSL